MAIKLRVLHYPDNKKMSDVCQEINSKYENGRFDKIPPAYPCENERLLIALIKSGKEPAAELKMFCSDLKKNRVQNVLFIFDAPESTGKELAESAELAGAKLVVDPKFTKFPGFFGKFSEDDKKRIFEWVEEAYSRSQS